MLQDAAPAQDRYVMSLKTQKRITMQTKISMCVVLIYISFLYVLNLSCKYLDKKKKKQAQDLSGRNLRGFVLPQPPDAILSMLFFIELETTVPPPGNGRKRRGRCPPNAILS
jgi:hypothetical protein